MIDNATSTIVKLSKHRVKVVAPITDPAWQTRKDVAKHNFAQRAFRAYDSRQVLVPEGSFLYVPEHPKDWENHPGIHFALEMIVFHCQSKLDAVQVSHLRPGVVFFFIPRERAMALVEGRQTELDLLRDLEQHSSYTGAS